MWGTRSFYFGDNVSVGVRNLDSAVAWYKEKLGLRQSPLKFEDCDALLMFSKDDEIGLALVAIPAGETQANVESHPILFTKKLEACKEEFVSRGVQVASAKFRGKLLFSVSRHRWQHH
jgi:hypothetical protein